MRLVLLIALASRALAACPSGGLEAIDLDDCPSVSSGLGNCDDSSLEIGDLCEADGECGTDTNQNNCPHDGGEYLVDDIYRVTGSSDDDGDDGDDDDDDDERR